MLRKKCKEVTYVDDKIRQIFDDMMDALHNTENGAQECIEACLSFPKRFVRTIHPQRVTVQALNEYDAEIIVTGEDEMA